MPAAQDLLLSRNFTNQISSYPVDIFLTGTTGIIDIYFLVLHHYWIGVSFILYGVPVLLVDNNRFIFKTTHAFFKQSWNMFLSLQLAITGACSITFAHHSYAMSMYPFLASDYATAISIVTHHMWVGGILMVGSSAHGAIYVLRDYRYNLNSGWLINTLLSQRDIITGHLVYVSIFLGLHAFGLFIHNDTLISLGRFEDCFNDSAIQLKPILATLLQHIFGYFNLKLAVTEIKIVRVGQSLGTADFMLHHIHAFTIHVVCLVLIKSIMYSRSSRLVSDKFSLGFRYPCDGPGRNGTCQISSWDGIFLGSFWFYNSISIVVFHAFWKLQSDVWGYYSPATYSFTHTTNSDFAVNACNINGWLRNFLWSQSAAVIQSYSSSLSAYSLIFLLAHFVWALSLMFLFSGRGYWQELIEALVWSHTKLWIVPHIQPRALSISQGRCVGVVHYLFGGIGYTWTFFLARCNSFT